MSSVTGATVGAAIGAVVGAVVLATVIAVDKAVYTPSTSLFAPAAVATRPAVGVAGTYVPAQLSTQRRSAASVRYAATQQSGAETERVVMQAPQGIAVYSWAWVLLATVAGAINGLFLWNNRRAAMAATTGRREALLAGVAAAGMAAGPAFAAYGDAANVFGKKKETNQFFDISGDGWEGVLPGKYNVSKEREVPGIVGRWEDNFDAVNMAYVIERDVGKTSVTELGNIDEVRTKFVTPLMGQQAFEGQSISEGGFAPGRYAAAAVLDQNEVNKDGKTYYVYEILTRTADGNEGGRHQLYNVSCTSSGKLIIFKNQAGDKRWFKGLERPLRQSTDTFKTF